MDGLDLLVEVVLLLGLLHLLLDTDVDPLVDIELLQLHIQHIVELLQALVGVQHLEQGLLLGRGDHQMGGQLVGELIGIVENFQDITKRKEAEDELAYEKERLAVTLNSIGDGVITTNIMGRIVMINKVAQKLTGWSQADAEGKPLEEIFHIIHEKSRQRHQNPVEKVLDKSVGSRPQAAIASPSTLTTPEYPASS